MNQLTPENAKEFSEKTLKNGLPELYYEYFWNHSLFVIKAAKDLAKEKNLKISHEFFEMAGYLHDIGYVVNEETHAQESLKLAEKEFGALDEAMKECILNHGRSKNPQTQEGKIFQMADKLSSFYPEFIEKLIDLEKREGKKLNETLEEHKKRLQKSLESFSDKDFQKIAKRYFNKFLNKYNIK